MAILFSDGCDGYDYLASNAAKKWTLVNSAVDSSQPAYVANGGMTGGQALGFVASAGNLPVAYQKNFAAQTQARFSFWHWLEGTGNANTSICVVSNARTAANAGIGGSYVLIGMDSSLRPTISINGSVVATGTTILTTQTWRHFEIYIDYKASGGTVEVRLNGEVEVTYSGATYNGSGQNAMSWFMFRNTNGSSDTLVDDILITSTTGATPNSWTGPIVINTLFPVIAAGPNEGVASPDLESYPSITAHSYWRINVTTNWNSILDIAEVTWHTEEDGPNVAVGGTSNHTETSDGNTETYWRTTSFPANVSYQFTSPIIPAKVTIRNGTQNNTYSPRIFNIEYSDNGSSWTSWRTVYVEAWNTLRMKRQWMIGPDTTALRLADGVLGIKAGLELDSNPVGTDSTYITLDDLDDQEMFEFSNLYDTDLNIEAIVINSVVKSTGYSNRRVKHRIRSDYNIEDSGNLTAPPSSSVTVQSAHPSDPSTGSAWTLNGLNAAEYGITLSL